MVLTLPNLDEVQKKDPKLGESLKQIQTYVNNNVTPVAGNKLAPPPKGLVNPSGT